MRVLGDGSGTTRSVYTKTVRASNTWNAGYTGHGVTVALIDTGCDISRIQHTGFFDRLPPILPTRAVNLMVEQPDGTYKAEPRNLYAFSISFPNTRLAPTLVEMMPWEIQKVTPGISFLLGRDFLGQCESFTYDGTQRTYSLTTDR